MIPEINDLYLLVMCFGVSSVATAITLFSDDIFEKQSRLLTDMLVGGTLLGSVALLSIEQEVLVSIL